MSVANERPYLWLLYVIVLVTPFVLCAACCVRSKVSLFIISLMRLTGILKMTG